MWEKYDRSLHYFLQYELEVSQSINFLCNYEFRSK